MPRVVFTSNLQRHLDCPEAAVAPGTVASALAEVFAVQPRARGYILDEQGCLRKHVTVFVDGRRVRDRERLSDSVGETSEVYVMQALTGG
ncbi:MAG TPA: MoaD/ThiS family protein [Burkholderiales bacterium]|nr:MoaD/ThiS family protein [Burkholderiales bacterium]